jgi:hypothetical protein
VSLPTLAYRLVENNKKMAADAAISQSLGNAKGMKCKPHYLLCSQTCFRKLKTMGPESLLGKVPKGYFMKK